MKVRWLGSTGSTWTNGSVYDYNEEASQVSTDLAGNFYIVKIGLSEDNWEIVSRDTPKKHKDTYEFKVSSPDAIDHKEISKNLTREHPIAIVKRSDGMHMVLIHDSIEDKSYHVSEELRDEFLDAIGPYWSGYQTYASGTLKKLMEVIKKLRAAPYTNKKELVCKVELIQ